MFKRWVLGIILMLIASGLWSGALAASEPVSLKVGTLISLSLSEEAAEYTFTPTANGLYAVYVFPGSSDARGAVTVSPKPSPNSESCPATRFLRLRAAASIAGS